MKKEREKIDELVKKTLNQEEAKFYDELDEQNLFGKIGEIFHGKMGWLAIVMNITQLIMFGLFIYCLVQFLKTEEVKMLVKWGCAGFLCMIMMGMSKMYVWMQMDKNDLLREMKRLKLQISVLIHRIDK